MWRISFENVEEAIIFILIKYVRGNTFFFFLRFVKLLGTGNPPPRISANASTLVCNIQLTVDLRKL